MTMRERETHMLQNGSENQETIAILKRDLEALLLLSGVNEYFDPEYYLAYNEDVRATVESGAITGLGHFLKHGFLEGRAPFRIKIDEEYYLKNNPDVAEALRDGRCKSAQWHYDTHGRREGRLPYEMPPASRGTEIQRSMAGKSRPRKRFQLVRTGRP